MRSGTQLNKCVRKGQKINGFCWFSALSLFINYVSCLNDSEALQKIADFSRVGKNALEKSTALTFLGTYTSILKKGVVDTVLNMIQSKDLKDTNSHEAVVMFVYGLMGDDNLVNTMGSKFKDKMSSISTAASGMLDIEKQAYKILIEALPECNIYDDLVLSTIKTIDEFQDVGSQLGNLVQVTTVGTELIYINYEVVNILEKNINPDSDLYKNLIWAVDNKTILIDTIFDTFGNDLLKSLMNAEVTMGDFILKIAGELANLDSTDDYLKSLYLSMYSDELGNTLQRKREELIYKNISGEVVVDSDIENYKILYQMYNKSVEIFL